MDDTTRRPTVDQALPHLPTPTHTPARPARRGWLLRGALLALVVAAVAVGGTRWLVHSWRYVSETDARIKADLVVIASRSGGWIRSLPATEGLEVAAGAPLALLDERDAVYALKQARAELDGIDAEAARLDAEAAVILAKTEGMEAMETANLAAAEALVPSVEAEYGFARQDYDRARDLAQRGVMAARDLERARTAFLTAEQARLQARAEVAAARSRLVQAEAERQRLTVLRSQRQALEAERAAINARIERLEVDLADRTITAPLDGLVTRVFVDAGEYVLPGQRIAMVHAPEDIWVETNIRETQIARLALGQPVTIRVDAWPDLDLSGTVSRIGYATTSQFALLPSPNPSGNFTKVTQRVPVKIRIDRPDRRLRPGMMVEVEIDTGTTAVPPK